MFSHGAAICDWLRDGRIGNPSYKEVAATLGCTAMPESKRLAIITVVASALAMLPGGCSQFRPGGLVGLADPGEISKGQEANIHIALAQSAELRGDTERAIEAYQKALEKNDSRADLYHRLALLHDKKGDCATACDLYRQALTRAPEAAEIHCDLGYSYYVQGLWSEAEESLRRASELQPDLARAHNNLGLLLARLGREDEAVQEFARAGLSEHQARLNLAFAATLEGQLDAAAHQLDLASDRDNGAANENLDQMRSLIEEARRTGENHQPVSAVSITDMPGAAEAPAFTIRAR